MAFDYIRGIMRPDGSVCVEYLISGEEEPGQVLIEDDLSMKSDSEIIAITRGKSQIFQAPDYSQITVDRNWHHHAQGNHD